LTENPAHVPVSTYRLQLIPGFGFREARAIVPYLSRLGISDCYVSPIFASRPGSTHGYDICDQNQLNAELGTREDFQAFCEALQQHSMGLLVDFVPNHMAIDPQANLKWRNVLENGPASQYAAFFDIDWDPVKPELKNEVLLPILDDQYGNVLEAGQLQIRFEHGGFSLQYQNHNLPLNPRQMRVLLSHKLDDLRGQLSEEDPDLRELLSIVFHLEHIPAFTETAPEMVVERDREKSVASERRESSATLQTTSASSTGRRATRLASICCTSFSTCSPIASPTGRRRCMRSITGAFLILMNWPESAWRIQPSSRPRMS
jgi:(1->4)-alpha-D-glucan 1-alpha-D-glucosylmutase